MAQYPTIAYLCEKFLQHKRDTRGDGWRELTNYELSFRPLLRLHGRDRPGEFKARDLESLQIEMATGAWMNTTEQQQYHDANKPIGLSRGVIRLRVGRIRTMWSWAEREGLAPEGSAAHLKTARPPDLQDRRVRKTERTKPTTREQLDQVLPHCPKPVAAMLETQWLTGMRSGEVRIMRPCDIDCSGSVWVYRPSQHKNKWRGQERVVHLGPECQRLLAPWLEKRSPEDYLFKPVRRRRGVKPCYSQESFASAVRKACLKAGVKIIPYGNRRAFCMKIAREYGPETARIAMGHAQLETQDIYKSGDEKTAAEVAAKIG